MCCGSRVNWNEDSRSTGSNPSSVSVLLCELWAHFLYISFSFCINYGWTNDFHISDIRAVIYSRPGETLLSNYLINDLSWPLLPWGNGRLSRITGKSPLTIFNLCWIQYIWRHYEKQDWLYGETVFSVWVSEFQEVLLLLDFSLIVWWCLLKICDIF